MCVNEGATISVANFKRLKGLLSDPVFFLASSFFYKTTVDNCPEVDGISDENIITCFITSLSRTATQTDRTHVDHRPLHVHDASH